MLERGGRWLLQLRADIDTIVHPGTWDLFGGHLEPGEDPEQALRREREEEIVWRAGALRHSFADADPQRLCHVFVGASLLRLAARVLLERRPTGAS